MSFNLRTFTQWFNQESDMAPKTDYSAMRKIQDIIDSIQIPNLRIDRDFLRDDFIFMNLDTHQTSRVSRLEIESSKLPMTAIVNAITQIMPISATHFGQSVGPAIGSSITQTYLDDPHEIDIKTKLFSYSEQRLILEVKQTIKALLFDTVPFTALDMTRVVVAGGCFASMLNKEPVKDYDVFMLDDIDNRKYVRQLSLSSEGNDDVRRGNSDYMNNKQIEQTVFFKKTGVQYITTKYKTREELIQHFDFKHCCVSYDFSKDKLYITREVYDLIKAKKLVQNSDKAPALWRYEKFHDRGWKSDPVIVAA